MTAASRVVLLHSALGDARLWRHQTAALAGRFDVVAPDLPGFGAAPLPTEAFSFVDTVTPLLPASLVGNSLGATIALRAAGAHPELVPRLVLIAAGLVDWQWTEEMLAYREAENAAIDAGDLDAAIRLSLDFWLAPEHHAEVAPQLRRSLELQTAHPEPELLWPESVPLSDVAAPTLVVVGRRDKPDLQLIAERLATEIPGAELAVVEDAGHVVGLEQPEALNRLLLEFLES